MIEPTKLASLQKKLKSDQKQRKPLEARPPIAAPAKGNDILTQLQSQLAEQARKKETLNQSDASESPEKELKATPGISSARPVGNGLLSSPKADLPTIIESGYRLAKDLEHSQAETPISSFFKAIPNTNSDRWPNTAILPASSKARAKALAWLTLTPEPLFTGLPDVLEVSFQKQGFSFRNERSSEPAEAKDIVEFAKIVKGNPTTDAKSNLMSLPSPTGFQNTKLVCARNAETLLERPAILSRMASQTSLLMVTATSSDELSAQMKQAIEEVAEAIPVILPVLFADTETGKIDIPEIENCRVLPTIVIDPEKLRPKPQVAMAGELKKELNRKDISSKIQSGIDLITERQTKREKEIRKRKKNAQQLQVQIESELKDTQEASRGLLGELRQKLDEQVAGILDWTKSRNKRQFSPTGEYTDFADEISNQLTESHLEKVESVTSRRYGLPRCVVDVIEEEVVERLHSNVKDTVAEIQGRLRTYISSVETELTEFHQQPVTIDAPQINEKEIWNEVRQYCQIDPKIGIDLPKRDALRMFMSGSRQFIMPISMILGGPLAKMLLPVFGADRSALTQSPVFTGTLVGLMVVGLVLFFRGARAMDREKMEQSVEKMRETVRTRIIREMERVEREKQELIQTTVSRMKEEWQGNLKTWVDEAITVSQTRLGRESAKVKSASVILQKRVREVDQTRKEVEKLSNQFEILKV